MTSSDLFFAQLTPLLERLERLLPATEEKQPDWSATAFRWYSSGRHQGLKAIRNPQVLSYADLLGLERQIADIERNTCQFLAGAGANNILLWGSRGTGKSSLVKAAFNQHVNEGLRLIEVDRDDLVQLPDILELLEDRPEKFILFCDDLSFEPHESGYKALKAILDGSLSTTPENVLIYATSNRRHLMPEQQADNQKVQLIEGEIHPGEAIEEKISLSDRFGLWISFHPFRQQDYQDAVRHWIQRLAPELVTQQRLDWETIFAEARQWSLRRGSFSGRTAWQFARDLTGRLRVTEK